ncbi:MAG: SlyX family protein [Rhodospirillales bacterium]|nr:SlyX family protein [Rhodospirillales bacterium]MBO6787863.1 SlyX family protein [Rhodospirillales bacterium]
MTQELEARITELEMTVTHQERTISELSDVVAEQWTRIEVLMRELTRLDETKADAEPEDEANRRPPHY